MMSTTPVSTGPHANDPQIHWRLHEQVVGRDRMSELVSALQSYGDTVQSVRGGFGLLEPPVAHRAVRAMTLTTLLDAKILLRQAGRTDELFSDLQLYDVSHWSGRLPVDAPYVNKGAVFVPLSRISELPEDLWQSQPRVFVRPDSGLKTFPGDTHERAAGWAAIEQQLRSRYPNTNPVQLCQVGPAFDLDPVEWRCWIADGKCFAHSPYSWDEALPWAELPEEAQALATQVADQMPGPAPIYVLDLVSVQGKFSICEINAFSTSGLYSVPFSTWVPGVRRSLLLAASREADDAMR